MHTHMQVLVKLLQEMFADLDSVRGAEVGVAWGRTSEKLLKELPNLHLTMIDPWVPWKLGKGWVRGEERLKEQQEKTKARTEFAKERREIWRMTSMEAAKQVVDGSLDFAFVDGDHRYEAVKEDIQAWSLKVKKNGLLAGHDYVDPLPTKYAKGRYPQGVKKAVDECVMEHGWLLERDAPTWLWWVWL